MPVLSPQQGQNDIIMGPSAAKPRSPAEKACVSFKKASTAQALGHDGRLQMTDTLTTNSVPHPELSRDHGLWSPPDSDQPEVLKARLSKQPASCDGGGAQEQSLESCMMRQEQSLERLRMEQESSFNQLRSYLDMMLLAVQSTEQNLTPLGRCSTHSVASTCGTGRSGTRSMGIELRHAGSLNAVDGPWVATGEQMENDKRSNLRLTAEGMEMNTTTPNTKKQQRLSTPTTKHITYEEMEFHAQKAAKDKAQKLASSKLSMSGMSTVAFDVTYKDFLKFAQGGQFEHAVGLLLTANAVFIGFQVGFLFDKNTPMYAHAIEFLFCLLFILEVSLRMTSYGVKVFFTGKDAAWNWFDFFVVTMSSIHSLVDAQKDGGVFQTNSVLRSIVRFFAISRVLRVVRILRSFKHLRHLAEGVLCSLWQAAWTLLLFLLLIYIFAVILAQNVAYHFIDEGDNQLLKVWFGSLSITIVTLFAAITGGMDWKDVHEPLAENNPFSGFLFLFFIGFTVICVMNVVTGIFCEGAIEAAQRDKELMIELQLKDRSRFVAMLDDLFKTWDSSGDGDLTLEEFEAHLSDDRMQALFHTLDVMASDAWTMFKLLDADGGGTVDADEFVAGCIRMRGNARAVHMEKLQYEIRWLMRQVTRLGHDLCKNGEKINGVNKGIGDMKRISSTPKVVDADPVVVERPPDRYPGWDYHPYGSSSPSSTNVIDEEC